MLLSVMLIHALFALLELSAAAKNANANVNCSPSAFTIQHGIAFAGDNINNTHLPTVEACETYCCATHGCTAFTFTSTYPHPTLHGCQTGEACCFVKTAGRGSYAQSNCTSGTTSATPPPHPHPPPPSPPPLPPHPAEGGGACQAEADCYYGGICSDGGCKCDPTWTGSHCSVLHLLPARAHSGYPTDAFNPTDALPTAKSFTWGGAVVKDYAATGSNSDGLYHGYFAEYLHNCPMTYAAWTSSTHIRHATSPTADGPWTDADVAVPQAAGNPVITRAPDGTWLLYFTNHKWVGGKIRNCSIPRPPSTWGPPVRCSSSSSGGGVHQDCGTGISLAYSRSLNGPWTIKYDVVAFSATNPGSPVFNPDGSLVMAYKTWSKGGRCVGIVASKAWNTWPYAEFPLGGAGACVGVAPVLEDPSNLWRDSRGNVHFLVHELGWGSAAQLPAGDATYRKWQFNNSRVAYPYTIEQAAGAPPLACSKREEPKVLLDAKGLPALLITQCMLPGALPNAAPSKDAPAGDPQFITRTTMQPINTLAKHGEGVD